MSRFDPDPLATPGHAAPRGPATKGSPMGLILLIVVIILLIGGLPRWNHSRDWGYAPTGVLTTVLLVLLILVLLGYVPRGF